MLRAISIGTALLDVISTSLLSSSGNRYDSWTMELLCGAIAVLPAACFLSRWIVAFAAPGSDLPSDMFQNPSAYGTGRLVPILGQHELAACSRGRNESAAQSS